MQFVDVQRPPQRRPTIAALPFARIAARRCHFAARAEHGACGAVQVHGTDYWYNFKTDRMTYYKPDVLSEMDEAAIMIQSVWRGKQWRTIASAMKGNKQWAFENAAATDIQRRFRGYM